MFGRISKNLAYVSDDKLWRNEFKYIVSAKNSLQDINLIQLKQKINDTSEKNEERTT